MNKRSASSTFGLTRSQARMLAGLELGGRRAWTIGRRFEFTGDLDPVALDMAVERLCERQAALRTEFVATAAGIMQRIVDYKYPFVGFRPSETAPVRVSVAKNGRGNWEIAVSASHLVCDGESFRMLLRELACGYNEIREGERPTGRPHLGDCSRLYLKYLSGAQNLTGGRSIEPSTASASLVPATDPLDSSNSVVSTGGRPAEMLSSVGRLSAALGASETHVLAVASAVVSSRWARESAVSVGIPVNQRPASAKTAIGPFTDLELFCVEVDERLPFQRLVADSMPEWIALMRASEGRSVNGDLHGASDNNFGQTPDITVGLSLHLEFPLVGVKLVASEPMELHPNYSISVELGGSTDMNCEVRVAFSNREQDCLAFLDELQTVLAQTSANPRVPLLQFPRISPDHEKGVRQAEMSGGATFHGKSLCREFVEAAIKNPGAEAVSDSHGTVRLGELLQMADRCSSELRRSGVRAGDYVAVASGRRAEFLVGVLAVHNVGAVAVPLDVAEDVDRAREVIGRLNITHLVRAADIVTLGKFEDELIICIPRRYGFPLTESNDSSLSACGVDADCDLPLYLLPTSGSTGVPKLVKVSCRAVSRLLASLDAAVGVSGSGSIFWNASPTFDASVQQWGQVLRGKHVVGLSESERSNPARFIEALSVGKCSQLDMTPGHVDMFSDEQLMQLPPNMVMLVGGERLGQRRWDRIAKLNHIKAYNVYGVTEAVVDSTIALIQSGCRENIGKPLPGSAGLVLDKHGRRVPWGAPGELVIRGNIADGYVSEDAGAGGFVNFEGSPSFATGDLVRRRRDGDLVYMGREDRQVKVRGIRLELGEVENALQRLDEVAVASCGVFKADGSMQLAAFCVPSDDSLVGDREFERKLSRSLVKRLRPTALRTVHRLPLNQNGKMDFSSFIASREESPLLSSSAVMRVVLDAWRAVLLDTSEDCSGDFFDLGGTSLDATRLLGFVEAGLGVQAPLSLVFQNPTVVGMVEAITSISQGCEAAN